MLKSGFWVCLIMTLGLAACNNADMQDLQQFVANLNKDKQNGQKVKEIPVIKIPEVVTYQANILRAPFSAVGESGEKGIVTNPLQAFSVNMLRFIGTLSSGSTMSAFILAPDNKIYQVRVGDQLGDHQGKVMNIYPDRMEVMEQVIDEDQKRVSQRIVTLELKEPL